MSGVNRLILNKKTKGNLSELKKALVNATVEMKTTQKKKK